MLRTNDNKVSKKNLKHKVSVREVIVSAMATLEKTLRETVSPLENKSRLLYSTN